MIICDHEPSIFDLKRVIDECQTHRTICSHMREFVRKRDNKRRTSYEQPTTSLYNLSTIFPHFSINSNTEGVDSSKPLILDGRPTL